MADPAVKLTKRQRALLESLDGDQRARGFCRNLERLYSEGLIASRMTNEGEVFRTTPAGRALLDALKEEGEGR